MSLENVFTMSWKKVHNSAQIKTEFEKRKHRCAFTGHRPEKLSISESEVKTTLRSAIMQAISDGYNVFISGMARGVDLWAAQIVLELRKTNKRIKLICALPYEGFELKWSREWQTVYHCVLENADYVHVIGKGYQKGVFQARNVWMVDHAKRLIAVYNGTSGGTRNTIEYARHIGIEVYLA